MIELKEGFTVGLWFIPVDATTDWMAHMGQTDTEWQLDYRFRYYQGDQTLQFEESQDRKSWTRMTADKANVTLLEFKRRVTYAVEQLERASGQTADCILVEDYPTFEAFAKALEGKSWTQVQRRTYH